MPPSLTTPPSVDGSKLMPPRSAWRTLQRSALVARLLDARRLRCTVVQGPAGFGKTTLLALWRQALLPLGFDVAWLSLAAGDDALPCFIDGLLASLAEVDPALVHEAADLAAAACDAHGVERLAIGLVRRMAEHPRDLVLVLDDVHQLGNPLILEALQWLLDNAPPRLHLAFGSRHTLPLAMDRLQAQQQLLALGPSDLRFTSAEADEFLRQQLGEIDARTTRQLHAQADGWAAGLQLLAADLRARRRTPVRPGQAPAQLPTPMQLRDAGAFARYFDQEVLAALTAPEVQMLVSASACSRFCAPLLAALVDQPDGLAQAAALLQHLQTDNLFIGEIDGLPGERWYRLHPLLREALLARFQAREADARQLLHGRAWAWLRVHGPIEDAIGHAVHAGAAAEAADLIERHAQALIVRGERSKLFELVALLPPALVRGRIKLRLWLARSQLQQREIDACAAGVAQLALDIPSGDLHDRYALAMLQTTLAVQRDDTASALAVLPQLLDAPPGTDAFAIGGRNNLLSWLYMHRGEFERARRVQLDAPPPLVGGVPLLGTPAGSLQGRCLVGLSYALEGQMAQAERTYRAVLREAAHCGRTGVDPAALATALLGDVLYERNDLQAARALLEARIDVLERVSIPDSVLRVFRVLAACQSLAGHPQEALAWMDRLEDYALRHRLDRLLAHALADRTLLHLIGGGHGAAQATLQRLVDLQGRHAAAGASALGEIDELTQRVQVRWLIAVGDLEAAAARLAPLTALCEARGRWRSVVQLRLQRAIVDARCDRPQAAADHVVAALQQGHRLGLLRTLIDAGRGSRGLIGGVARTRPLDPVLAFYAEQLLATRTPAAAGPAAAASPPALAEAFNERELDVLRLLAQAMPNKKIARVLALSPETVKWYLSRIYAKLQVSGRDEAVARVRDLRLDTGTGPADGASPDAPAR